MGVPLYLNSQASKSSLAKENYQQRDFVINEEILAYRKCVQNVCVLLAAISPDSGPFECDRPYESNWKNMAKNVCVRRHMRKAVFIKQY